MQRRIDQALWACIVIAFLGSVVAAVEISVLDAQSIANSRPPEFRPSRDVGEFEIMMSRHRRSPYVPTFSAIVLLVFLISSQLIILRFIPKPQVRWLCFIVVTLIGIVWTWYQITPWLFDGECNLLSKLVGEPVYYVLIPFLFFTFLTNSSAPWTPLKTLGVVLWQIAIHLAWFWVWAFTQLIMGWYWI